MVDLEVLSKKNLEKLAKECNITLRSGNKANYMDQIINAGINENRLIKLVNKYPHTGRPSKKRAKEISQQKAYSMTKIEERVNLLEEQVRFLMSKIGGVEVKLVQRESFDLASESNNSTSIGSIIKTHIPPGDSMTIDELIKIKELQKFSLNSIEQAIITLIDNEVFDVSQGGSIQKIGGNIGRLIRR